MKKLIYVTGAGRGIGQAIALKLAEEGYLVSGCSRTLSQLQETQELSKNKIQIKTVNVSDEKAIGQWLDQEAAETGATPWGLVTAAGIYGPIGPFLENSWSEWRDAVEINLYGTLLAIRHFAKKLIAQKLPGRVLVLSGGGATQPMPNFTSYCASKSSVVRVAETLAYEFKKYNITVNSLAPGAVTTKLTDDLIEAGPEKAGADMYAKALKQKEDGGANPEKGANLAAYLMSEKAAPVTGRLLSAIWDPWSNLDSNTEILSNPDIFTMKRLVPEGIPGLKKSGLNK